MSVGRRNRCLFSCLNHRKYASGVQILIALFKFLQKSPFVLRVKFLLRQVSLILLQAPCKQRRSQDLPPEGEANGHGQRVPFF